MKLSRKLIAAIAMTGVVLTGVAVGQTAQAALIPGTITITPTSGTVDADPFLNSIAVSTGCPVGFQDASVTSVVQGAVNYNISNLRTPAQANPGEVYGTWGLGGAPISIDRVGSATNSYVSNNPLAAASLADGNFELRVYCFASRTVINSAKPNSPWFSLTLTKSGNNWSVPVAATATSVSLSAGTTANAGEVSLSASVKDAAGSAVIPGVAGSIAFKEGATTVATVATVNGVATALLTGVANGTRTYTAEFVPSNGSYNGSTSAAANVTVGAAGTASSTINVAIPSGLGTLTLTGVSSSVNLGTAALSGGTLNASGTLNAVVTDTRQLDYPAWSLTGIVGDFSNGTATLDGKYLGWTPAVSGPAGSVAGSVIAPAPTTNEGLKVSRTLATGAPNVNGAVTNASALLLLQAPANTPAGAYSATLTLTLI